MDGTGLEEMGRRIAWAVDEASERSRVDIRERVTFGYEVVDLHLPLRKVSRDDSEQGSVSHTVLMEEDPPATSREAGKALRFRRMMEEYVQQRDQPEYAMEMHVMRLGDVALATNPFELFLDYGLRIKAQSQALQTFVVQLACDRGIYLPTEKALRLGSYGAALTEAPVGP